LSAAFRPSRGPSRDRTDTAIWPVGANVRGINDNSDPVRECVQSISGELFRNFGRYAKIGCQDYLSLLSYVISQVRQRSAREEVAFELAHPERFKRMYNRQRVILISIPLALFLLALLQE
jgi:hypothetical protein